MDDISKTSFFQRPIGQMSVVGWDEAGNPVYENKLTGAMYGLQPNENALAAMQQQREVGNALVAAAQSGQPFDPALYQVRRDIGTPVNALAGLAQGVMQGITAPGRAARGEPVTYGDVWAAALDYGAMGAPMSAPQGAIRSTAWNTQRMYHGTPDVRDLEKAGAFEARTIGVRRMKDPARHSELMAELGDITPGTGAYIRKLDELGDITEYAQKPSPVFVTPDRRMAATYADDTRAFDYQNAIPATVEAKTTPKNVLDVNALGETFRGIKKSQVRKSLIDLGFPESEVDTALSRYIFGKTSDKISTDDLAALASDFGFDAVDVSNVKDNYFGGGSPGRVRMMLDPSMIDITAIRK